MELNFVLVYMLVCQVMLVASVVMCVYLSPEAVYLLIKFFTLIVMNLYKPCRF